jgi:hypothetical protein
MTMTWTPEPHANTNWTVRQSGSVRRISELGRRRITEAGAIRIIDRFELHWTTTNTPPNSWHPS